MVLTAAFSLRVSRVHNKPFTCIVVTRDRLRAVGTRIMRWTWSCLVIEAIALVGVVQGDSSQKNTCLDPGSHNFRCYLTGQSGHRNMLLSGCGLTDDDIHDLQECFDSVGRANINILLMAENNLSSPPADLFSDMTSLWELFIFDNDLPSIPEDLFAGLPSLEYLYMYNTNLASLSANQFSENPLLVQMYLYGNKLTSLPDGVFAGLTSLTTLWLEGNQLAFLPSGVFEDLSSLQTLRLDDNQLTTLHQNLFSGLTSLDKVWLGDNDALQCVPNVPTGVVDAPESVVNGICGCLPMEAVECDYEHNYCVDGSAENPGYFCKWPAPGT